MRSLPSCRPSPSHNPHAVLRAALLLLLGIVSAPPALADPTAPAASSALPHLADGRSAAEVSECSTHEECALTWHRDGSCCDSLCSSQRAYRVDFIAELDAQRADNACAGAICPIASCMPPTFESTARCVEGTCSMVPVYFTPQVRFDASGCSFDGASYRAWESFPFNDQVCGCSDGAVMCQPSDLDPCFASGRWYPSGQRLDAIDGCNSATCEAGAWTGWTLLECTEQIADRVPFDHRSATLSAASAAMLDELAVTIGQLAHSGSIQVVGHADHNERRAAALARKRAKAVREALIARGVPAERLVASGEGDTHPRGSDAENRRVEFALGL